MNRPATSNNRLTDHGQFRIQLRDELTSILTYWSTVVVDHDNGGFLGAVDYRDEPDHAAPKGVVMMARICWAFSEGYRFHPRKEWHQMATRAYDYLVAQFWDREHGGMYWSVTAEGGKAEDRKQVYGQAFCIYALASYYRSTGDEMALHLARDIFYYIERYCVDIVRGGYLEAFTSSWKPLADMRLSGKDLNEPKTANTHLHLVEAYAQLYTVAPSDALRQRIQHLLYLFDEYFIAPDGTLRLFFNDRWENRSQLRSFGHEIEAAWLLLDCAKCIDDAGWIARYQQHALQLAAAAMQGMDDDGGLWYELEPEKEEWIREKHSWPQAEAMLGFVKLWQLTGQEVWMERAKSGWEFIKSYLKDNSSGEWYWGVYDDYRVIQKDKAGFWKCPYHNSRAVLEILYRLSE